MKTLATLHISFAEVLYIDVNNRSPVDAAKLFASAEFTANGAVFWPADTKTSPSNPIWDLLSIRCVDSFEQGNSILLVSKAKSWKAVNLAVHLSGKFYQNLLNGNKDAFRMAFAATSTSFFMEARAVDKKAAKALGQELFSQLPEGVTRGYVQACTVRTVDQRTTTANEHKISIAADFGALQNGSSKDYIQAKAEWTADCKAFAAGTTACDASTTVWTTEDYMIAYWNVTLAGNRADRLQFWAQGTTASGGGALQNFTILEISKFDGTQFDCDGKGFLYNKVELNDGVAGASYLLKATFEPTALKPLTEFQDIKIKIVYNSAASVVPSVIMMVVATLFAWIAGKL